MDQVSGCELAGSSASWFCTRLQSSVGTWSHPKTHLGMYLFPSSLSGCWQHWVLCWLLARAHCQFLASWVSPTWQLALSKHAKWKDNTESRPAKYVIIFSNLIMEVTPITFRLRRKSHSREEISQGHEHKEMEIIGGHVRSCHRSRKQTLE